MQQKESGECRPQPRILVRSQAGDQNLVGERRALGLTRREPVYTAFPQRRDERLPVSHQLRYFLTPPTTATAPMAVSAIQPSSIAHLIARFQPRCWM